MKRILLFIVCLFILPVSVSAEKYTISEFKLSIEFPNNYLVITVDNYKNNPVMESYGITPEYMEEVFTTYNAYLDAFDMLTGLEMFIVINPVIGDYSNYTKEELEELIPAMEAQYKSLGADNIKVSIENVNGTNYFLVDYYHNKFYLLNYYLVYQNNGYNFQLQSTRPITSKEKEDYKKIINTITFNDESSIVPPVIDEDDTEKISGEDNTEKISSEDNTSLFIIIGVSVSIIIVILISASCKSKNKCSKCGMTLSKEVMFCPNCGTKK